MGKGQPEGRGSGGKIVLSKRLRMLADMVTPGHRLADVGCDHGFLCIYLVQTGICPRALAMDVRTGPLAAAGRHIGEAGLGDYITARLSDGLAAYRAGEADAMVCAGMGGRLMERILIEGMDKAREMKELVLQPQSEIPRFREFLREAGFQVVQEDAVFEEGKYYFAMKAQSTGRCGEDLPCAECDGLEDIRADGGTVPCGGAGLQGRGAVSAQRLYDLYGEHLLLQRHPVLLRYLLQREAHVRRLEASLAGAGSLKAQARRGEVRAELEEIEAALRLCRT